MKLREILELVQLEPFHRGRSERVTARTINIDDLRTVARRRLPRAVFDYVDGGADEELTMAENRAAFRRFGFEPRTLVDVSQPDLATELFGRRFALPLALCPTGYTRMLHRAGEPGVARAAAARSVPYALSTVGTTTIEELATSGHQDLWFQLYPLRDRGRSRDLVERAASAGYRVLEVAVDTTVAGRRERDVRNGLTIPPALRARTLADIALHVSYWSDLVRGPALQFASLGAPEVDDGRVTSTNLAELFDPSLTWDDLYEIRTWWLGPLLLKGQVSPADAQRAISLGIDGIHLSNHGGRQLDRSVPTVELLRPLRAAVGDEPAIVVDSGIRHGNDIAVALALGADLGAVGRAYLYGLAACGEAGVLHVIDLLASQLRRAMQLLGVTTVAELRRGGDELLRELRRPTLPTASGESRGPGR